MQLIFHENYLCAGLKQSSLCQQYPNLVHTKVNEVPSGRVKVICNDRRYVRTLKKVLISALTSNKFSLHRIILSQPAKRVTGEFRKFYCLNFFSMSLCEDIRSSPQTSPSVLKLEGWNFAYRQLIPLHKSLTRSF